MDATIITVKNYWNKWELRVLVLLSLLLQIILTFAAGLRKRSSSRIVNLILWLSYLLADIVATFSLGILARRQGDTSTREEKGVTATRHLQAFWAPFLLLHLGGPDPITAFSLEDNQLWPRHAFGLVVQVSVAAYVLVRSFPEKILLLPSIAVFLAGTLKFGERTVALYLGSMDGLRKSMLGKPDPGPDYAETTERYVAKLRAGLPAPINLDGESRSRGTHVAPDLSTNDHDKETLCSAYAFFLKFKGLFVDAIFSFKDREHSRSYFVTIGPDKAFKVIEIQLEFAYEVLYTKAPVSRTAVGCIVRAASLVSNMGALLYFYLVVDHNKGMVSYPYIDLWVTYSLLIGAVALEVVAVARLVVSEWTIVLLDRKSHLTWRWLERVILWWHPLSRSRWSNSLAQYNLLSFCLEDRRSRFLKFFMKLIHVKEIWDHYRYTTHVAASQPLKDLIFKELKKKSAVAEQKKNYEQVITYRGEWALEQALEQGEYYEEVAWSVRAEFDESLLIWHIATHLCYHFDNSSETTQATKATTDKEMAKALSEYLLYLLVVRPQMLSSIAVIGIKRYGDTCAEVAKFFLKEAVELQGRQACLMLLAVNTDLPPTKVKGDKSKSVLWEACILAKQIQRLEREKRWVVMCGVWVEMLSYAAINCRGNFHAQQLSGGAELVTFVWFLMAHMGLGQLYKIESGYNFAKLLSEESLHARA